MILTESFLNKFRALLGYQKGEEMAENGRAYFFTDLKGRKHGRYTEYHNNGNLMAVARFHHDLLENFVELDPQTGRLLRMVEWDITNKQNLLKTETEFDEKGRATLLFHTENFPELEKEKQIWDNRAPKDRTARLTAHANELLFINRISQPRKQRKTANQQHEKNQG